MSSIESKPRFLYGDKHRQAYKSDEIDGMQELEDVPSEFLSSGGGESMVEQDIEDILGVINAIEDQSGK